MYRQKITDTDVSLKCLSPRLFEEVGDGLWTEGINSRIHYTGSRLWFGVDGIPAFQDMSPSEKASWGHLLQANLLETFSEATVEHLAKLGFECDSIELDPKSLAGEQTSEPEAVAFPFFVADFDQYTHNPYPCSSPDTWRISRLRAGALCAAALSVFQRLEEIAVGEEGEEPRVRAPMPSVVVMTFCGRHVRIWIAHRVGHKNLCVRTRFH